MCCGKKTKQGEAKEKPVDYFIRPAEFCVMCAEKHISTAFALAAEVGYECPNRQRIVGELSLAALHLWDGQRKLAEDVRSLRHSIQHRDEIAADWHPILTAIDWLVAAEVAEKEVEK